MTRTADIVVIGAGVMGAANAWRLAERGLKVVVLEQASPASGSIGKSAAEVRIQFLTGTNVLLAQHSIQENAGMPESGYVPAGHLILMPEDQGPDHRAGVAFQHHLGLQTQVLTPEVAQSPAEFVPDGLGGCTYGYGAGDGFVDPHNLTFEYVRRAKEAGATFLLGTTVTGAERSGGVWKVTTPAEPVEAPLLLNAGGAWAARWGRWPG